MPPEQALPMHTEQCKRRLSNSLANKRQRHASQATHSPAALHSSRHSSAKQTCCKASMSKPLLPPPNSSATPPYKTVHHFVCTKRTHTTPLSLPCPHDTFPVPNNKPECPPESLLSSSGPSACGCAAPCLPAGHQSPVAPAGLSVPRAWPASRQTTGLSF